MKRTWLTLTFSMIFVLIISVFGANYLVPLLALRTYSETACLTDQIDESMDVYDIAKLYRDNCATVAVTVEGVNLEDGYTYMSLGSGVCVASKGYETTSLDSNIVASRGSYLVTNYHVIDMIFSSEYVGQKIQVITENEQTYSASLLWSNKNLDVALLYCEANFDYVQMKDRIINPQEDERVDYEPVFTIGTPLDLSYLNRLTKGDIANNNLMVLPNVEYVDDPDDNMVIGLYNVYEDIIDISAGITNGNSGGGCFDENGILIGLTTIGLGVGSTGGNQMNGIVPIYPIIEILDKQISNKEKGTSLSVYTVETLGIKGFDSYEAYYVSSYYEIGAEDAGPTGETHNYYYFEGEFYPVIFYQDDFEFSGDGYYILKNSSTQLNSLPQGTVINTVTINGYNLINIIDRNDFIYALLQIDDGDLVEFACTGSFGQTFNKTIQF